MFAQMGARMPSASRRHQHATSNTKRAGGGHAFRRLTKSPRGGGWFSIAKPAAAHYMSAIRDLACLAVSPAHDPEKRISGFPTTIMRR